tara:strand:+ start:1630 stop:3300 length:1671 start_codon:yes stop_codon:yes gene_type:complete
MVLNNFFDIVRQVGKMDFSIYVNQFAQNTQTSNSFNSDFKNGFVFKQFASFESSFDEIKKIRKIPNDKIKGYERVALSSVSGSDFDTLESTNNYFSSVNSRFSTIKSLSKTIINNLKELVNLGGIYKNDKLVVTADDRGVFDFSLASLGLYRPIEFYSEELKQDIEKGILENPFIYLKTENGVVLNDKVIKVKTGLNNGFKFFINQKEYDCERRQKGATKVLNNFSDKCFLKQTNQGIFVTYSFENINKVFNGEGKIRLKYASSNKKSYLIYDKKDDNVKYVDIFVPVNYIAGKQAPALNLIPAYLVAVALEGFGIETRISAMRIGTDRETTISVSIPVKNYTESTQESFDRTFNLLGRQDVAKNYFKFFKIIAENEGIQADATGDTDSAFDNINYYRQDYVINMMQRYKNWAKENKDKSFINTKVSNPNFQFGMVQKDNSLDEDLSGFLSEFHIIMYQFYYYMDFLAIEFREIDEMVSEIYSRFTENEIFKDVFSIPDSKQARKDLIRKYINTMLIEKYQVVEGGKYADSEIDKKEKEDKFSQKIFKLSDSLNNL